MSEAVSRRFILLVSIVAVHTICNQMKVFAQNAFCESDSECTAVLNAKCVFDYDFCSKGRCICPEGYEYFAWLQNYPTIDYKSKCLKVSRIKDSCDYKHRPEKPGQNKCVGNSVCDPHQRKCVCPNGYRPSEDRTVCMLKRQSELNRRCDVDSDCVAVGVFQDGMDQLRCVFGKCDCLRGYHQEVISGHGVKTQTYCVKNGVRYDCTSDDDCKFTNSVCHEEPHECQCNPGYVATFVTEKGYNYGLCAHREAVRNLTVGETCNQASLGWERPSARFCKLGLICAFCASSNPKSYVCSKP